MPIPTMVLLNYCGEIPGLRGRDEHCSSAFCGSNKKVLTKAARCGKIIGQKEEDAVSSAFHLQRKRRGHIALYAPFGGRFVYVDVSVHPRLLFVEVFRYRQTGLSA
ncbi:MAG: hypothetical protein IJD20_06595 [Oscillospiraceae bacterium]|nr:hypothetical protein [Oscillospiraceae bacterium]